MKLYYLYKGDELITSGTLEEVSERMKLKPESVSWLSSPANRKRYNGNGRIVEIVDTSEVWT